MPSARQLVYGDGRANPAGRLPDDTWILRPQDLPEGFQPDENTWYFPRVCGTFKERAGWHGCQMPEQLLGRIIRACSHEGDLVLDPFAGSGTTLAVAKKLGRRFLGFELSKEYSERILQRLAPDSARATRSTAPPSRWSACPTRPMGDGWKTGIRAKRKRGRPEKGKVGGGANEVGTLTRSHARMRVKRTASTLRSIPRQQGNTDRCDRY